MGYIFRVHGLLSLNISYKNDLDLKAGFLPKHGLETSNPIKLLKLKDCLLSIRIVFL